MKGDPEFVILKYQAWMEASAFEDAILGAIIKDPLSPSTNYVPDSPLKYKTHEHQKGEAYDFVLAEAAANAKTFVSSVPVIGGFSVLGNKEDIVHLAGKFIRYKRIQQLDQFWAKLKEDADVKETAPRWISFFNSWPVSLVVGIMICEDVELSMDAAQSSTRKGNGEIPIGHIALAAGIPIPVGDQVNPQFKSATTEQKVDIFKAKMGRSRIFAVELKKITTKVFRRKELQLKRTGPELDEPRFAGYEPGDFHDSVIPEDLILDEFGHENYEDMVG